jgi:hypothetical protein
MTTIEGSANWLADRAGLNDPQTRSIWINACVEVIRAHCLATNYLIDGRQELPATKTDLDAITKRLDDLEGRVRSITWP